MNLADGRVSSANQSHVLTELVDRLKSAEGHLTTTITKVQRHLSPEELTNTEANIQAFLASTQRLARQTPPATSSEAMLDAITLSQINGEPTVSQAFIEQVTSGELIDLNALTEPEKLFMSRVGTFVKTEGGFGRIEISAEEKEQLLGQHQFITNPSSPAMAELRDALVKMMQAQYQAEVAADALGVQLADLIRMAERLTVQMERLADELAAKAAAESGAAEAPVELPATLVDRGALAGTETLVQAGAEHTHRVGQQYLHLMRRDASGPEERADDSTASRHAAALDRQDARLRTEYQHAVEAKAQDRAQQRREARVVGDQVVQGVDGTAVAVETNAKGQVVGQSVPAADK